MYLTSCIQESHYILHPAFRSRSISYILHSGVTSYLTSCIQESQCILHPAFMSHIISYILHSGVTVCNICAFRNRSVQTFCIQESQCVIFVHSGVQARDASCIQESLCVVCSGRRMIDTVCSLSSDFAYFSVNDSGVVTLQQLVPINVSTMTYKVHVIDGGGLATNFTINFNINRQYCTFLLLFYQI